MDLIIRNGTIVTATEIYQADIGIQDAVVAVIGLGLQSDNIIDADGKYVFPGAIDPHTHMELGFMGTVSADDSYTGTVAAACGGTTTIIDYAEQTKGQTLHEALQVWQAKAEAKAVIDYGFHVSVTDATEEVLTEMEGMVAEGVSSFKCYLAYEERLKDDELLQVLLRARDVGALVNVHCENGLLVDFMTHKLLMEGKTEPRWRLPHRPPGMQAVRIQLYCRVLPAVLRLSPQSIWHGHPLRLTSRLDYPRLFGPINAR
jgi:dihydropyrimidinase